MSSPVCCSCGAVRGRLWKCSCSRGSCVACSGRCSHVTCENGACSAELECSDSSMIVVCLCCADAAKPFSKDKVSQGSDASLGESDDCRIDSDTAEEALYEAAEWRHCDQGHQLRFTAGWCDGGCDVCPAEVAKGEPIGHCKECSLEWWICKPCFTKDDVRLRPLGFIGLPPIIVRLHGRGVA